MHNSFKIKYLGKFLGITSMLLALNSTPSAWAVWETTFYNQLGHVSYEEDTKSVKGDWDSGLYKAILSTNNKDKKGWELEAELGLFGTQSDTETWYVSGLKYQTNDMDFSGGEIALEGGYALNTKVERGKADFTLTPLVGYGYRTIRFERTNFNVLNTITSREIVNEDYFIHYLELGCDIDYFILDKTKFFAKVCGGLVIDNRADNSSLGTIDGDGGYIGRIRCGVEYNAYEDFYLGLGLFWDLEHLHGGTSGNLIWPDNDLNSYGLMINGKWLWGGEVKEKEFAKKPKEEKVIPRPIIPTVEKVEAKKVEVEESRTAPSLAENVEAGKTETKKEAAQEIEAEIVAIQKSYLLNSKYVQFIFRKIRNNLTFTRPKKIPEGEVCVAFSVTSDGRLSDLRVIEGRSTDIKPLKDLTIQAIKNISPFPSFSKDIRAEKISFVLNIQYNK